MTRRILTVVTFKWKPTLGYRSLFLAEHVNVLRNMLERNLKSQPWRLVCVTDDPDGIDKRVKTVPLWDDYASIPNPSYTNGPSCYRRLKVFSPAAKRLFGSRILMMDLDVVIVGDISQVVDRKEDFVILGDTNASTWYNGSLVLFTAGARPQLWEQFDPVESPKRAQAMRHHGSDQGWITTCLGTGEAKFGPEHGVYSYRTEIMRNGGQLPKNAKIVIMHGKVDPWSREAKRHDWVQEHWR